MTSDADERLDSPRIIRRWVVGVVLLGLATVLLWRLDVRAETGLPFGAHDFIAYWSAYDVVTTGGDPYDAETLRSVQESLHPRYEGGAQRYWNPPWALLPLVPVLVLPFELATAAWLVLSAAAALGCVGVSWRLFVDDGPIPPLAIGASLVFLPLIECLRLGQMGAVVALAVLGGLLAIQRDRDVLAGMLLATTVVKPQVAVLVLLVVGIHVVATRRWAVVWAGAATAAGLIVASRLLHPEAWGGWESASTPTHWHSATVAGWLRAAMAGAPEWPMLVVPGLALLVVLPYAIRHRDSVSWSEMPLVLVVSFLVAPYAWIADAVLLLPVVVLAVGAVARRRAGGVAALAAVTGIQALALVVRGVEGTGQQHMIVVPLGLMAVAWWMRPRSRERAPSTPTVAT